MPGPNRDLNTEMIGAYIGVHPHSLEWKVMQGQIRSMTRAFDVLNQSSDRWDDAMAWVMDNVFWFSRRRTFRRAWNKRDASPEGRDLVACIKALVTNAAGNNSSYTNCLKNGIPPWVTDFYHMSDGEESFGVSNYRWLLSELC